MKHVLISLALYFGLISSASAQTEAKPTFDRSGWNYRNATILRLNPSGLIDEFRYGYRSYFFDESSLLTKDAYASMMFAPTFTPAYTKIGFMGEIQPLSILQFSALWEWMPYFGNFDMLQSFPSPNSDFSPSTMEERSDSGLNYAATGQRLTLLGALQGQWKMLVARSTHRLIYSNMAVRSGDSVFYDIHYDALVPTDGWFYQADNDVAVKTDWHFTFGARHSMLHSFYPSDAYAPGESEADNDTHRLGPLVAYTFFEEKEKREAFNAPTVFVLANWWLKHPYRTGQEVSQAMPMLAIGFSFRGDL